jgi:hypothetical protein
MYTFSFYRNRCWQNKERYDFHFVHCRRALEDANDKLEAAKKSAEKGGAGPTAAEKELGRTIKTFDWLYVILNTLDSKASALMRLNGVMVAAVTFLSTHAVSVYLLIASSVASTLSIFFCLFVVSLDWTFYQYVKIEENGVNFDSEEELFHLQQIVLHRETMYRTAWYFSLFGIITFLFCLFFAFGPMLTKAINDTPQSDPVVKSSTDS